MIYLEDCRETLKKDMEYNYVLTSPPDFDELGLNPKKDSYDQFLYTWMPLLNPKGNLVSICISDRKVDSIIYTKHISCINVMEKCGWKLKSYKIWVKSYKINMFRLNYMHLLTFQKKPHKANLTKEFKEDVFLDESSYKFEGYGFGMSQSICEMLINEHTQEGNVVYDPFMGSGTTACAALSTNRNYLGSEISEEYKKISEKRIKGIDKRHSMWYSK